MRSGHSKTDSIRQKVYDSENAAKRRHVGKTYTSHKQVERRVFAILDRAYIKRNYPRITVTVDTRRSNAAACCMYRAGYYALQFPTPQYETVWKGSRLVDRKAATSWAWCDWVILHELAHAFNAAVNGRTKTAGHGREFAIIFLDLVRNVMGREAHAILKEEMRSRNVPTTKARKRREVTPEQRAELVDRMAKARAARDANLAKMQTAVVTYEGGAGRWGYGQTKDGVWVVVGPDGQRRRSQSKSNAIRRVQTEARREARQDDICMECGGGIRNARPWAIGSGRRRHLPTECGCSWGTKREETEWLRTEFAAERRRRVETLPVTVR